VGLRKDIRRSQFERRKRTLKVEIGNALFNIHEAHRSAPIMSILLKIVGYSAPKTRKRRTQQASINLHLAGKSGLYSYASTNAFQASLWC
jgi:hypothetical protein